MSYKSLLACVDQGKGHPRVIETGLGLAAQFGACLTALHVHVPTQFAGAAWGEFPVWGGAEALEREEKEAAEREARLRSDFEAATGRLGIENAEWRHDRGELAETLARHARYGDLVIMGQHDFRDRTGQGYNDLPAEVCMLSGRPVLALPYSFQPGPLGTRALVAWNGSVEAVRAVTAALPLLAQARAVDVVIVDGGRRVAAAGGEPPGADLARYLDRHGIKASLETMSAGDLSIAEALLAVAADKGSDLLCMGAYGHSRLRELALGGATWEILRQMTVPTLLAG